jgi:hypothetical protein
VLFRSRIDPATNSVDLSKRILGGYHYGYSDMTGIISRTATTKLGVWTLTHDSHFPGAAWGTQQWVILLGAVMFYFSDVSVARDRFVAPGFINGLWGLPLYYGGQLFLAYSVSLVGV